MENGKNQSFQFACEPRESSSVVKMSEAPPKSWKPHKIVRHTQLTSTTKLRRYKSRNLCVTTKNQLTSTTKLRRGKSKNLCETTKNKTRMKLLCELMPKYFTGAQTLMTKKGIRGYKEEVEPPSSLHSPHSVLEEHNYFTSKTSILKLQDAVTELGSIYDDLKNQFDTLSQVLSIKNDLISHLSVHPNIKNDLTWNVNPIPNTKPRYPNWRHFSKNKQALKFFTGFDEERNLKKFMRAYTSTVTQTGRHILSPEDEVFFVLSRLKLGLNNKGLMVLFEISSTNADRMFEYWVELLDKQMLGMGIWPTSTPKRIIIDCMKVFYNCECLRWAKIVLGMTCKGIICFMSDSYTENLSEVQATKISGILDMFEAGDEIVADNGLLIENFLKDNVKLTKPRKVRNDPVRFNEVIAAKNVAERTMKNIKSYKILDTALLPKRESQILKICCHLVNYNRDDFWDTDVVVFPRI